MEKILLSWIAYREDFGQYPAYREENKLNSFNPLGPTFSFHENFWDNYDKHIIISSHKSESEIGKKEEREFNRFCKELKEQQPNHEIDSHNLPLNDPSDLKRIKEKIDALLLSLNGNKIDIFISPGTPAMQTAWYLSANIIPNTTLIQTYFNRDNKKHNKKIVEVDYSERPKHIGIINESNKANQSTYSQRANSTSLKQAYSKAEKIAATDNVPALILGANGTGKEGVAQHIVDCSSRKKNTYKKINCAGYTDELLRSELFGYVKGAFTGADKETKGVFEQANGGTIFLDEIGDISPFMQINLLRVLQEDTIQKVGSSEDIKIDVRIIAATNKNLLEMCEKETFRLDLYYRLNPSLSIILPTLQARGTKEIEILIEYFNNKFSKELDLNKLKFDSDALSKLKEYHYPGNIRELQSIIQSLLVFSKSHNISLNDIPKEILHPKSKSIFDYDEAVKRHLIFAYENGPKKTNGKPHITEIVKLLGEGMSKSTFQSKLKDYEVWGNDD